MTFLNHVVLRMFLIPTEISSEVQVNKKYERTKVEPDTVLLVTNDTLSTKEDRSGYVSARLIQSSLMPTLRTPQQLLILLTYIGNMKQLRRWIRSITQRW